MSSLIELVGLLLTVCGALIFTAGTVGLIRFPDVVNRLHALTKADNLGLGLVLAGVALIWADIWVAIMLVLIWLMALAAGSISARVLAERAAREDLNLQRERP